MSVIPRVRPIMNIGQLYAFTKDPEKEALAHRNGQINGE